MRMYATTAVMALAAVLPASPAHAQRATAETTGAPGGILAGAAAAPAAVPADAKTVAERIKAFRAARTRDETPTQLVDALNMLAETRDPAVARVLAEHLSNESPDVRRAAARALGIQSGPAASRPLVDALRKYAADAEFAKDALKSLGALKSGDAAESIAKFAGREDAGVGLAAVEALGQIAHPNAIDALIRLLEEGDTPAPGGGPRAVARSERLKVLQPDVRKALQAVTEQKLESLADWKSWWAKAKAPYAAMAKAVEDCAPVPGAGFETAGILGAPSDKPAAVHVDINVKLRGAPVLKRSGGELVGIPGATEASAVKLNTIFADDRVPGFTGIYTAGGNGGCPMAGFQTRPGEVIECPARGANFQPGAFAALVLYADADSITLKYTFEDNVVKGYTIHMLGLCVDPRLLKLYQTCDAAGRKTLPALRGNQPFARARSGEIVVGIRDCGTFMYPLSKKDWW